jgi:hypothetical protein
MYQNNRDRGSCIPPTNRKILGFVINLISSILSTVTAVLLSNGRGSGFFPSYDEGALNRMNIEYISRYASNFTSRHKRNPYHERNCIYKFSSLSELSPQYGCGYCSKTP